jgi:hypothetical protein
MADAWFSIFCIAERHQAVGLWLEDLLDRTAASGWWTRLWRLPQRKDHDRHSTVDCGPFHVGFGIVVTPDEETTHFAVSARARGYPIPFRHSLSATLTAIGSEPNGGLIRPMLP